MFIPPGEIIHESLATSYVLVDALVADLCEGGFSGVVEVVLRDTDSFVVIANGNVAAAIERRGGLTSTRTTSENTQTTVEQLSERSRRERGRVSIYGYSAATANSVAARIGAKPLYLGLSTEFTDLEKMIAKLVREQDREWFIEVNTLGSPGALIHMRDCECRIIGSTGRTDSGRLDVAGNRALDQLIDECNRASGTFDVYFTEAATETSEQQASPEHMPLSTVLTYEVSEEEPYETFHANTEDPSASLTSSETCADSIPEPFEMVLPDDTDLSVDEEIGVSSNALAAAAATHPGFTLSIEPALAELNDEIVEPQAGDLSIVRDEFPPPAADAEAMAEIRRLMGEIARAIEEAAQSIGRPDSFSMSLRAGQLQVADRFPFLDPFAGEFEYLAGEIVFVGHTSSEEFIEGLTQALKLAIEAVARSTAYADRFRSYVTEDLRKLLARERDEFDRFGLEDVIRQLATF